MEDPVVKSGRREAAFALCMWLAAMIVTVTLCYRNGYHRAPGDMTFVLWFPDWVFWGLIVPWLTCIAISMIFAFRIMQDAPIEEETEDADTGLREEARGA